MKNKSSHNYHECSFCLIEKRLTSKIWKFARTMTREQYGRKIAEKNTGRRGDLNYRRIAMTRRLKAL